MRLDGSYRENLELNFFVNIFNFDYFEFCLLNEWSF